MLHLHGSDVMFDLLTDYPVQVINWHDRETPPTLADGQIALLRFGMRRPGTNSNHGPWGSGNGNLLKRAQAIQATGGRRFILGTGCVLPITAPHGNILAARRSVE
jgi:uroporphyrinogen decarboxylase